MADRWIRVLSAFRKAGRLRAFSLKLVTLTIKTSGDPKRDVRVAKNGFERLWSELWAIDKRSGALVALEVGMNQNVHLHILLYGRGIKQAELSRVWCRLTGSYVVHIKALYSIEEGVREVIKYLLKPVQLKGNVDGIAKVMLALKRVRRYWQKGSFYCLRVVMKTSYRCSYCMSEHVVADFPWREIHGLGVPPLVFREFSFRLPTAWYGKKGVSYA
jgi:hypothetical protein